MHLRRRSIVRIALALGGRTEVLLIRAGKERFREELEMGDKAIQEPAGIKCRLRETISC